MDKNYTISGWGQLGRSVTAKRRTPSNRAAGLAERFYDMTREELASHCDEVMERDFTLDGCDFSLVSHIYNKLLLNRV